MSRRCFKSEIHGRPGPEGHTGFWHHVAFRGIALQPHCGVIFPHPSRVPQRNTPLQRHDRRDKRVTVHPPRNLPPNEWNSSVRGHYAHPFLVWVVMEDRFVLFKKDEVARSAWWEGYWCCVGSPGTVFLCTTTRSRGLRSQDFRVVRGEGEERIACAA